MATADLEALLGLQDQDTRIDQELHRKAHLPERLQLAELQRAAAETETALSVVAAQLAVVANRQGDAERELKATEDRMAQVNKRLYGGGVSASRELQVMASDVEFLQKRASELEDRVLSFMEEREPLDGVVSGHEARLAELAARQAELSAQLAEAEVAVDHSIATLRAEREKSAAAIPGPLLASYERLRGRLQGVAVARLVGGRCDGCHLSLPAMELDRIRHDAARSPQFCEQCGRILVITSS
jgi:hypothetical protein